MDNKKKNPFDGFSAKSFLNKKTIENTFAGLKDIVQGLEDSISEIENREGLTKEEKEKIKNEIKKNNVHASIGSIKEQLNNFAQNMKK